MNFKIGDQVMHCREGLSIIFSTAEISGNTYFLVKSVKPNSETIYVPHATANSIIRPLLSTEEADKLLSSIKTIEKEFNANTKQRRDSFKRRLSSGDVKDIAFLYRLYYLFRQEPEGVKLGPSDIDMLSSATNMFLDELSLVYCIDRQMTDEYVISKIEKA